MNNKISTYIGLALLTAFASCADDKFADFQTEKPESLTQYEYLNAYDNLKSYIDRSAHPGFKLGAGVSADDFLKGELVRSMVISNFDEITAGNAMKYASCVSDNGIMDFSKVSKFVEAAKAAGVTIYGHTLCWHSQQNNKYLNSLIANKPIPVDPTGGNKALHIHAGDPKTNAWDYEIYYDLDQTLEPGKSYTLTIKAKGSNPGTISFWPGLKDGNNPHYGFSGITAGEDLTDNTINFTPEKTIDRLRFCFGKLGGDLYFDDVTLKEAGSDKNLIVNSSFDKQDINRWTKVSWIDISYEIETLGNSGTTTWYEDMTVNGNAEGSEAGSFFATEQGIGGPHDATIGTAGTGADGKGHAYVVKAGNNPSDNWSTQFFIKANRVLHEGDACKLKFKYRADKAAGSESQAHEAPGSYVHYDMGVSVNFTTQWQTFEKEFIITKEQAGTADNKQMQTIAWNLAVLKEANTYYFDDIEFGIQRKVEGIPLTEQEKKDTLTWAMDRWINGIMEATGGYVTAWDAVNESVSGVDNDNDGFYDLQSNKNVSAEDAKNNFYWQDYLGDLDYVRIVIRSARKHFAEHGGNPSDLKLFINDYNLESWWDDNKKAKSLINWIKRWESDGVTKIDGIGTQMHVSYILDEADQKRQEASIVKMFELLAASGKLVKISELDMGITKKAFGEAIKTEDVTYEQQLKMAEFYRFIIEKYFEIIPVAQQYGITQWCTTDSPESSSWRGGQPVGLWTLGNSRKPTYGGFANGLAGREVVVPYAAPSAEEE